MDDREPMRAAGAARFNVRTTIENLSFQPRNFGKAHRAFRLVCRLTMADVARAYGITAADVSALESGKARYFDRRDLWAALNQLWLMRRGEP